MLQQLPQAIVPETQPGLTTQTEATPPQPAGAIDWIDLALSLREPEIEVLRLVYLPEPKTVVFLDVYARLERLGYSQRTARRKIAFLAGQGLIGRLYSGVGFVAPLAGVEVERVQRLLAFLSRRRDHPTANSGITEELAGLLRGVSSHPES
jgi:hypothetical protein